MGRTPDRCQRPRDHSHKLRSQPPDGHREGGIHGAGELARIQKEHLVRFPIARGERQVAGCCADQVLARVEDRAGGNLEALLSQHLARPVQQRRYLGLALLRSVERSVPLGDIGRHDDDPPIGERDWHRAHAGPDALTVLLFDADLRRIGDRPLLTAGVAARQVLGGKGLPPAVR